MEYEHPLYTPASVAAQRRLPEIDTDRVAFAGAYHGWGFHEDGARSGLRRRLERAGAGVAHLRQFRVVSRLGAGAPPHREPPASTTRRSRTPGARRSDGPSPTARTPGWSTSTTCPTTALLGRFEGRDHLGDPALHDPRERRPVPRARTASTSAGGRVLMAAHPRAFGHCFNPISVFWCFDAQRRAGGRGGRGAQHVRRPARLPRPPRRAGPRDHAEADVRLAVPRHRRHATSSPCPTPGDRLHVAVTLHTDDGEVFSASLDRHPSAARPWRAAPAASGGRC